MKNDIQYIFSNKNDMQFGRQARSNTTKTRKTQQSITIIISKGGAHLTCLMGF